MHIHVWICAIYVYVFQGVQEQVNLTSPLLSKEDPIFGSLSHKLGRSMDEVGHGIQQGLLRVRCTLSPLFTLTNTVWSVSIGLHIAAWDYF